MSYFTKYRLALVVFGLLLIALFLFTTIYFHRMEVQVNAAAEQVERTVLAGDAKQTASELQALRGLFDGKKWTLKLLLDHEEIDKMEIALEKAERATQLGDWNEVLYELDELRATAEYIGQIELPLITNIF